MQGLKGYLIGRTSELNQPFPLDKEWNRTTIIRMLKDFFDLDYQFLEERDVPIKECQDIYKQVYNPMAELARADERRVLKVVAAYANIPEDRALGALSTENEDDFVASVRRGSKPAYRWQAFAIGLFHATCISFMLSVIILTVAAIVKVR